MTMLMLPYHKISAFADRYLIRNLAIVNQKNNQRINLGITGILCK